MTHSVIIIPGLGDDTTMLRLATGHWYSKYRLTPVFHPMGWRDYSSDFTAKFNALLAHIDDLATANNLVSVIGTSAGGSAAINALLARSPRQSVNAAAGPESIHRAISVCGRLRVGPTTGFRSFERKTSSGPAFAESVQRLESQEESVSDEVRKRIMTVRARYGDELVPAETSSFPGAKNITIPTIEHGVSIILALGLFSDRLSTFLQQES